MSVIITVTLRDDDNIYYEPQMLEHPSLDPWVLVEGPGLRIHVVSPSAAESWRDAFQKAVDLFAEKAAVHALSEAELEELHRNRPLEDPEEAGLLGDR